MAKLTYQARKGMKPSTFAVPGAKGAAGNGKYPIPDESHARNALARVSAFGSSQEKAQVHHAVAAKFPELAKRSESIKDNKGTKANSPHTP